MVSRHDYESGSDLPIAVGELFYRDQKFYKSAFRIEGQNSFCEYFYVSVTPIITFFVRYVFKTDKNHDLILTFFDAYLSAVVQWMEEGCKMEPVVFVGQLKIVILELAKQIIK